MNSIAHLVDNGAGWRLSLTQTWDPARLQPGRRPVLIVPGYGMNSYIFSYHPRGPSFEGHLCAAGFEVWRVDLRAQGRSIPGSGPGPGARRDFGLEDLALIDLPVAIEGALSRTRTGATQADVIGASLGGSLAYALCAVRNDRAGRIGALVAMGAPVRWVHVHPAVRLAAASPTLVGLVPFYGTRKILETVVPHLVGRLPWLFSAYINPEVSDLNATREMVKTVEDPNRHINRQIARWVRDRDLVLGGRNVSGELHRLRVPLLCVLASHDGVVPRETALYPYEHAGSADKSVLVVGEEDPDLRWGHADLFIGNQAQDRVFRPIAEWLAGRS